MSDFVTGASKPYIVNVTDAHIARGLAGSTTSCPVALAIADAIGAEVVVSSMGAWWVNRTFAPRRPLPVQVRGFVKSFDLGIPVAPISFVVTL